MNLEEFEPIIKFLAITFPNYKLEKPTIAVYFDMLKDFSVDELTMAAKEIAADSTFFPAVSEIRKKVISLRMRAANIPNGIEAWDELIKAGKGERSEAIEENGQFVIEHKRYVFSCPLIEKVAKQLGWPRQFPQPDSLSYERTTFIKAFEAEIADFVRSALSVPEVREAIARGDFAKNLRLPSGSDFEELPPPGGYPVERGWTTVDSNSYDPKDFNFNHGVKS